MLPYHYALLVTSLVFVLAAFFVKNKPRMFFRVAVSAALLALFPVLTKLYSFEIALISIGVIGLATSLITPRVGAGADQKVKNKNTKAKRDGAASKDAPVLEQPEAAQHAEWREALNGGQYQNLEAAAPAAQTPEPPQYDFDALSQAWNAPKLADYQPGMQQSAANDLFEMAEDQDEEEYEDDEDDNTALELTPEEILRRLRLLDQKEKKNVNFFVADENEISGNRGAASSAIETIFEDDDELFPDLSSRQLSSQNSIFDEEDEDELFMPANTPAASAGISASNLQEEDESFMARTGKNSTPASGMGQQAVPDESYEAGQLFPEYDEDEDDGFYELPDLLHEIEEETEFKLNPQDILMAEEDDDFEAEEEEEILPHYEEEDNWGAQDAVASVRSNAVSLYKEPEAEQEPPAKKNEPVNPFGDALSEREKLQKMLFLGFKEMSKMELMKEEISEMVAQVQERQSAKLESILQKSKAEYMGTLESVRTVMEKIDASHEDRMQKAYESLEKYRVTYIAKTEKEIKFWENEFRNEITKMVAEMINGNERLSGRNMEVEAQQFQKFVDNEYESIRELFDQQDQKMDELLHNQIKKTSSKRKKQEPEE